MSISSAASLTKLIFRPGTRQIWLALDGESGGQGGSSSSAAATGSGSGTGSGTQSKAPVTFSSDQQEKLQELIDGVYAKAVSKTEGKYKAEVDRLTAEIEKLKGGKGDGDGDGGDKGDGKKPEKTFTKEQVEQALAKAEEKSKVQLKTESEARAAAEERATKLLHKELSAAIVAAAARAGAIDPEEVADLTLKYVGHDEDGSIIILNEKGGARLGPKGEPLTVDEFVKDWIDKRPHHKKGSGTAGAGSGTDNRSGTGSDKKYPRTFDGATQALADVFRGARR